MSKITDYFLLKAPSIKVIDDDIEFHKKNSKPDGISNGRIILSIIGLILGIFLSFLITGLEKVEDKDNNESVNKGITLVFPSSSELWVTAAVSLVICLLSYQGLYASLRIYTREPTFLILFVSFQYGFFWQSVVKGGAMLLSN